MLASLSIEELGSVQEYEAPIPLSSCVAPSPIGTEQPNQPWVQFLVRPSSKFHRIACHCGQPGRLCSGSLQCRDVLQQSILAIPSWSILRLPHLAPHKSGSCPHTADRHGAEEQRD